MREVDKAFLAIFKDLKITRDITNPGTDENPNYICHIGKNTISAKDVVKLVKRYQDSIVAMLLEEK